MSQEIDPKKDISAAAARFEAEKNEGKFDDKMFGMISVLRPVKPGTKQYQQDLNIFRSNFNVMMGRFYFGLLSIKA